MLNSHEVGTPLWGKLSEHYEAKLAKLRAQLENPRIDESKRLELAWRISEVKAFLSLAMPDTRGKNEDV